MEAMAMAEDSIPLAEYEELRRRRVEENKRKMQALGLFDLARTLKPVRRKYVRKCPTRLEARRSLRVAGKPAVLYSEGMKLVKGLGAWSVPRYRQPLPRRIVCDSARTAAVNTAEEAFERISTNPAFVKPMLHSHTAGGFWLGLPAHFCKDYLPRRDERMTLEDEEGREGLCVYLVRKAGLSGGWKGWAIDHRLVDGDCCVFELVEPLRFKVRIFRCRDGDTAIDGVEELRERIAPGSAPAELESGRNLNMGSIRKLDLGEEERCEIVNVESSQSSRKRKYREEEEIVVSSVEKKAKEEKVVVMKTAVGGNEELQKPGGRRKSIQTSIRSMGRITRNLAAKLLLKKSE